MIRTPFKLQLTGVLLATVCLLAQSAAFAGLLRVAPVRVFLEGETRTASVELTNPGDRPISIQVDTFGWTQRADGSDEYSPTTKILAFPPIFTIQAGESQLVRIGSIGEEAEDRESAYRVYFTELSEPAGIDDTGMAISMRLRLGIPVFVAPAFARRHELRIVNSEFGADGLNISVENLGNAHVRITDLVAPELTGAEPVSAMKYILPGARQDFSIPVPNGTAISTVQAITDQLGVTEFDLDTGLAVVPADFELASR